MKYIAWIKREHLSNDDISTVLEALIECIPYGTGGGLAPADAMIIYQDGRYTITEDRDGYLYLHESADEDEDEDEDQEAQHQEVKKFVDTESKEETKMKTLVEIELTRNNVTPAQFLAYVRATLKRKDLWGYNSNDLDLDYFATGNDLNCYYHDVPEKPCKAEKSVSRPYEMQSYIRNWDDSIYNEIVEFEFDDEKTGHGYYYLIQTVAEVEVTK